ncbi:Oxidoreductase AflY [Tolypocladium capitatum]|uniref:Oxidoreductase AflY n=1 Tax=Tolypocladium capitatum TaxID=45235 RepID=A0A2K3QEP2_9HYPO|nr:Oxidoreductase AflY [Tolypocladium capitatum]
MATAYQIHVLAPDTGLLAVEQDEATAAKVTELLQRDLERHHVFFNAAGFHNHILHQLLALYGTGAAPDLLQQAYDKNEAYQVKAMDTHSTVVQELHDDWAASAPKYLGKGRHFADFLAFFQRDIEHRGWRAVLTEYVFDDASLRSADLRGRLFEGLLHPMIQLMYGVEWEQPAIVAEGLAQAAVHESRIGEFLSRVDKAAAAADADADADAAASRPRRTLADICETIRRDSEKLATSARWEDSNRDYHGVLTRAEDEAVALLAQIRVSPDEVEERTAEMIHCAAYIAAAASWNPPYIPKFDFFFIHHLTSAPLFLVLNKHAAWIPAAARARLLEWKLRLGCFEYFARGSPPLRLADALETYAPGDARPAARPRDLLPRFHGFVDDGHIVKTVRALLLAQDVSRKWAGRPWIRIEADEAWLTVMYMLLRGVEGDEYEWVRSAGFKEAWEGIPKAT